MPVRSRFRRFSGLLGAGPFKEPRKTGDVQAEQTARGDPLFNRTLRGIGDQPCRFGIDLSKSRKEVLSSWQPTRLECHAVLCEGHHGFAEEQKGSFRIAPW